MSLIKEVSAGELLHMRDEGMSNRDIANALDVSYQSVLRAIGKQPPRVRKPVAYSMAETASPLSERDKGKPDAHLSVRSRLITLAGEVAEYSLDCSGEILTITVGNGNICIPLRNVELLMNELSVIQRNIPRVKIEDELW